MPDQTQDEKKQQREQKRKLLGLLLFLPLVRLRGSVSQASASIEDSFDAMYDAYEAEESVAGALVKGKEGLLSAFTTLIANGLNKGYRDAAKYTGGGDVPDFNKLASRQASKTVNQMLSTTRGWLKNNGTDGFTLSHDRAERAAKYSGAEAYFNGLAAAFKDSEDDFEKKWNTSSDEPCDECLDNEDEDWIAMGDDFQSGHYAPLLHPNCQCYLTVRRAQ